MDLKKEMLPWKKKIKEKKGSSLAIVICVAALFLAFALALVSIANLLLSGANRRLDEEQRYQLAKSFAQVLDQELKKYETMPPPGDNTFYEYACKFLEGQYGTYDPDHPEATVFHYTAAKPAGMEDAYGNVKVALYKEGAQEEDMELAGEILPQQAETIRNNKLLRYLFTLEVTVGVQDQSYCYRKEYRQMAVYQVEFTHNGTRIIWNDTDSQWHELSLSGAVHGIPPGEMIHYEYQTDEMTGCSFQDAGQYEAESSPEGVWEEGEE